ncbi:MAG: hypothetical protein IJT16_10450 [Lachnospiraceae bacterium]|nr:hypothetical protein [Lachnospiraceae bacterium]
MNKDFHIENERLYTSFETANICDLARTTLLKIEEKGFDQPRRIDPETKKRYYDVVNINRIMQYKMFHSLGLNTKEILAYYKGELDREKFLSELRGKLASAKRCVDEFEARLTERESLTFSYTEISGGTFYCFSCPIRNPKEQIEHNYIEIQRMYEMGYKPFPMTPMASVTPDLDTVYDGMEPKPFRSTIVVAVSPEHIPDPSRGVKRKAKMAFSLTYHGNEDEIMNNGGNMLWEEMKKRGITPAGPLLGICLAGPFFGTEIDPRDYIFRWSIAIEK